jgi:hypothetical protein
VESIEVLVAEQRAATQASVGNTARRRRRSRLAPAPVLALPNVVALGGLQRINPRVDGVPRQFGE